MKYNNFILNNSKKSVQSSNKNFEFLFKIIILNKFQFFNYNCFNKVTTYFIIFYIIFFDTKIFFLLNLQITNIV